MKLLRYFRILLGMGCLAAASVQPVSGANPVKTVEGEYTYYGDRDDSPADCKRKAAQHARVEALRQFGTIVSHNVFQFDSDDGKSAESRFLSLSESEVKGEWLGDIGEPQYETSFSSDDTLVVKCKIKGKARAISNEAVDFETLVLRNGTDRRNADTSFRDGDDMYLYFSSPVSGYLSVFLQDESGETYSLLPYPRSARNELKVNKGWDYVFFDRNRGGNEFGTVEELVLTASGKREYNKVYVVFSPNLFSSPAVRFKSDGAPPSTDGETFSEWLVRSRRNDPRMGVRSIAIAIDPSGKKTETIKY